MQVNAQRLSRSLSTCAAVCLAYLAPGTSGAQQPQADAPERLEEIVVSARKRAENIQDVPISITAYSGEQLGFLGVQDLADVAHFAPNLQFDRTAAVSGSSIASTIFIRGIGQTDFTLNSDPGVGVYVDGVYIARSVGSLLDLIDPQTVEVLRGPQGTLFGKNTIGGALNITSRRPSSEANGYIEAQAGDFARHNIKARLDAPISSTLLTSLSFASLNEDGYQRRVLQPDAPDLGNVDRIVARARALWQPTHELEADFIADYSRGREQSVPQSVLVIDPGTGAPFLPAAAGLIPGTVPTLRPGFAGQFAGVDILNGTFLSTDPRSSWYGGTSRSDFDIFGASLTLSYDFGPVRLKSITAYREIDSKFARDSLSSPFVVADTFDDYDQNQWSQELQLAGDWPDNRGNYVAGVFYLAERGTDSNLVDTSIGGLGSGGSVDNESFALFAQTDLHFTDRLGATLGARYTDEQKGFTPGFRGGSQVFTSNANGLAAGLRPTVPLILDGDYQAKSDKVDVTASLQLRFSDALLAYGSYSTGFKAGGFSQRIGPGPGIPAPSFRPEKVAVVELGMKWLGLDGRLRLNGAVFHTSYDDVQITPLFEGIGPVTRNAGQARIDGAELEWAFVPSEHWDVMGGLGLLDTKFTSLTPESQVNQNLDGTPVLTLDTRLAKSPDVSANLVLARHWLAASGGRFTVSVDWSYTSKMFNDVLNSAELRRPDLSLIGAALSLVTPGKKWTVTLRGVNLTDEEYIIAGNAERYAENIGYTQGTYARPREWWFGVRRDF
jgi:iron complex outermembrane receptor protein